MPLSNVEIKRMLEELDKAEIDPATTIGRIKAMIYGPKGTGKTVFALQYTKAILKKFNEGKQKIVYIDTSEGWVALRNHPGLLDDVIIIPFMSFEHLEVLLTAINRGSGKYAEVGAVILDEFSLMVSRDLEKTYLTRKPDALIPEWKDYNIESFRVRRLISAIYVTSRLHLVAISHEKEKKNEEGMVLRVFPNFNPAIGDEIMRDMHVVAYMTAKSVTKNNTPKYEREFQVHPTNRVEAKTRVGGLNVKATPKELLERSVEWLAKGGEDLVDAAVVPPLVKAEDAEEVVAESGESEDDEPIKIG